MQQDLFTAPRELYMHRPHCTGVPWTMLDCTVPYRYDWIDFGGPLDAPETIARGSLEFRAGIYSDSDFLNDFGFRPL